MQKKQQHKTTTKVIYMGMDKHKHHPKKGMELKTMEVIRNEKGAFDAYAWPGGYPLFYVCADGGVLCPDCANKEKEVVYLSSDDKTPEQKETRCDDPQWHIIGVDVNYEDELLYCDHCNKHIISAYGNDE